MSDNNDPGTELRRDIEYNTTNMGELGKYIRVEHVLSILDRYNIISRNGDEQLSRFHQARNIIYKTVTDEREMLTALYQVLR